MKILITNDFRVRQNSNFPIIKLSEGININAYLLIKTGK